MQSVYSFMGSPLQLVLDDDIAADYNRAMDAFLDAQKNHLTLHGTPWTGGELLMRIDTKAKKAWDQVASVINLLIEINGGGLDIPEEQCTSDYLVKVS